MPDEEDAPALLDWILVSETLEVLWDVTRYYDSLYSTTDPSAEEVAERSEQQTIDILGACVTTQRQGAVVSYQFNGSDCPRGLHELTGVLNATYEKPSEGGYPTITLEGQGVRVNGAVLNILLNDATDIHAEFSGTGQRGEPIDGDASMLLTSYDASTDCLSIEYWAGSYQYDGAQWDSFASAPFRRCNGHCPSAGEFVSGRSKEADQLTLIFDGSQAGSLSTGGDDSLEPLQLDCSP